MNKAYMAKLGWKLAQAQPKLAQQCIRSKYMYRDRVTKFQNGSIILKSIGQGWDLLRGNSSWTLHGWVEGPLSREECARKVHSLVGLQQWDLSTLSISLPECLVNRILSTIPPLIDAPEDLLIPNFVNHKGFMLKQAYMAQLPNHTMQTDLSWIWKGLCEPKLQFFMWLLWHDRIPHRQLLSVRGMTHDSSCPRCQEYPEHSAHIIRECRSSRDV